MLHKARKSDLGVICGIKADKCRACVVLGGHLGSTCFYGCLFGQIGQQIAVGVILAECGVGICLKRPRFDHSLCYSVKGVACLVLDNSRLYRLCAGNKLFHIVGVNAVHHVGLVSHALVGNGHCLRRHLQGG